VTLPKDFAEMMTDTITVYGQSSIDKYGKQTFGSGTSYYCRLINEQRILRDNEGREIIESGRAVIYGMATINVKDKIGLASGATPAVTSVSRLKDEDGDHHMVVGFGV
jgi:hypothetical protein